MLIALLGPSPAWYLAQEFVGWATEVGFSSFELIELVGTAKAAVAYK